MSGTSTPRSDGARYEIRVQAQLDSWWSAWLDGMTVQQEGDRTTLIRGTFTDQSALHGLLAQLRDLNVPLISVSQLDPAPGTPDGHSPTTIGDVMTHTPPQHDAGTVPPETDGRPTLGTRETLAVVQTVYGSPRALSLARVPRPVAGPGEVLVEVQAASVNARDWHIMRGEPRLARLLDPGTFGRRGPRTPTRGTDLAGIVVAVGEGVDHWAVGDRVFGEGTGTFARHAVARADQLAAIPAGTGFESAAAVPLAGTTAALCIDAAGPTAGDSILINGASGGVGTFAIQLARAKGLRVTAVVSSRNVAQARSLGADRVIDYTTESVRDKETYDVVLDLVGNLTLRELRSLLTPGGGLVLSGGGVPGSGRVVGPLKLLVWAQLHARLSGLRVHVPQAAPHTPALEHLAALLEAGTVTPVIDRRYDLAHTADALEYVEREHARAKVVITTQPTKGHVDDNV